LKKYSHFFLLLHFEKIFTHHEQERETILIAMAMYWVFYMLIQQMLNIQALVLGFEMERFTLLVVMCDFMWRKKHIVWAFER
jgi:hypothetical protein